MGDAAVVVDRDAGMPEVHTTRATETHHSEHLLDRAARLAMRAMLALQPAADLGPSGRVTLQRMVHVYPANLCLLHAAQGARHRRGIRSAATRLLIHTLQLSRHQRSHGEIT